MGPYTHSGGYFSNYEERAKFLDSLSIMDLSPSNFDRHYICMCMVFGWITMDDGYLDRCLMDWGYGGVCIFLFFRFWGLFN